MKILLPIFIVLFAASTFAQKTFELKDASKYFDIKINVEKCDDSYCTGKTTFSFFKKGGDKPYQVITLPDTQMQLGEGGQPVGQFALAQALPGCQDAGREPSEELGPVAGAPRQHPRRIRVNDHAADHTHLHQDRAALFRGRPAAGYLAGSARVAA